MIVPDSEKGIGKLKISVEFLNEFLTIKPDDLEVIGAKPNFDHFNQNSRIYLIVQGPQIPTVSADDEIECLATDLGSGKYEFDFHTPKPFTPMSDGEWERLIRGTCLEHATRGVNII